MRHNMNSNDYWQECIAIAAEECDLTLSKEQLQYIADAVESGHDNYGMAFYSPPSSDRLESIKREEDYRFNQLEREFQIYKVNVEKAMKTAFKVHSDDKISIGEYGEVFVHNGRTERIQ